MLQQVYVMECVMEGLPAPTVSRYHKGVLDSSAAEPLGIVVHVSQPDAASQVQDDELEEASDREEEEDENGGREGAGEYSFSRELIAFSLYGKIPTKSSECVQLARPIGQLVQYQLSRSDTTHRHNTNQQVCTLLLLQWNRIFLMQALHACFIRIYAAL